MGALLLAKSGSRPGLRRLDSLPSACVQGALSRGQGPPGAGLTWKGLRTTCWEGSGKVPRTGPGVVPWPRFSGVRTTREPPGSTEVASVTQAPQGSGAAVGGQPGAGGTRSIPFPPPQEQGPRAGRLRVSPDGAELGPAPGSQRCGQWPGSGPARGPCTFSSPALLLCPGNERGAKQLSLPRWLERRWM